MAFAMVCAAVLAVGESRFEADRAGLGHRYLFDIGGFDLLIVLAKSGPGQMTVEASSSGATVQTVE